MADIDIDLDNGAAKLCNQCGSRIHEGQLNRQLAFLRDLQAGDFYICQECVTVHEDSCQRCGGAVYVPRKKEQSGDIPNICPACRHEVIQDTGDDPGWNGPASA